jgi:hypothetical protein
VVASASASFVAAIVARSFPSAVALDAGSLVAERDRERDRMGTLVVAFYTRHARVYACAAAACGAVAADAVAVGGSVVGGVGAVRVSRKSGFGWSSGRRWM